MLINQMIVQSHHKREKRLLDLDKLLNNKWVQFQVQNEKGIAVESVIVIDNIA